MQNKIVWAPQAGPQQSLIRCPVSEILFGGARGGGKTDGVLGKFAIEQHRLGKAFKGVFFRQEMPQADDLIERAREIYTPLGGDWKEQSRRFVFPNGATLRFRPLESTKDAEKYQGQNLSHAAVEEAGNYPDPAPIDKLWGALRSAAGAKAQMILTANPGGPGQLWLKERFIDPCPGGNRIIKALLPNGREHRRVFIPSKVRDNKLLLSRDPDYVSRLYLVGSKELVKAWLDGDWSAIEGAYFSEWNASVHQLRPFPIPADWPRFRSMDWGSAKPFSVGWWAVVGDHPTLPRGALVRYNEWYGKKSANVGLKMTAEQVAEGIKARTPAGDKIAYTVADPAMWAADGGPSFQERFAKCGVPLRRADNKRVARDGAMGGWDEMRQRLVGNDPVTDDNGAVIAVKEPMLYCFGTCADSIRTIPVLQHDEAKPEDLNSDMEDHAADEWRYACMSRPWTPPAKTGGRSTPGDFGALKRTRGGDAWKTA